jgi:hypothetical protein
VGYSLYNLPVSREQVTSPLIKQLTPLLKYIHPDDRDSTVEGICKLMSRWERIKTPSVVDHREKVRSEEVRRRYAKIRRALSRALAGVREAAENCDQEMLGCSDLRRAEEIIHDAVAHLDFLQNKAVQHFHAKLIPKSLRDRTLDSRPYFDPLADKLTDIQADRWLFENLVGLLRLVRSVKYTPSNIVFLPSAVQDKIIRAVMYPNNVSNSVLEAIGKRRWRLLRDPKSALALAGIRPLRTK